ncbi:MAG: homoserine dehydrogenase [Planctomycetes bacterium]|nr:homoserine dehydrogenase [Planctomycetota bacterium]
MNEKMVNVGLIGFGTVGAGVAKLILESGDQIAAKTGIRLHLACVVDLDVDTPRPVTLPDGILTTDVQALTQERIDIVVELIGGTGYARTLQLDMLRASKHVVTANKALLAEHGTELYQVAREMKRCIAFEASCAGGIPIVSAILTGLAANDIQGMYGIVNGTCNYILSKMSDKGTEFAETLAEAQEKGYAEADPTLDINGGDSTHKLAIMGSLAFGYEITLDDIFREGIEDISIDDIRYGQELGYTLKLLAIGQKQDNGKISLRVHPAFILNDCALARVDGPFNAVSMFGDAVGEVMFYGRGAGMMPTASAVVADVIEVAMGNSCNTFEHTHIVPKAEVNGRIELIDDCVSRFYLRVMAKDHPGVMATCTRILADHQISISGALQHEAMAPHACVPVVITTHETREKNMMAAIEDLADSDVITAQPRCIRIVDIPEDREA